MNVQHILLENIADNTNHSFTVEEIRELMDKPANIRNMSVIAHGTQQDHMQV